MNVAAISGNLTRDGEFRETANGNKMLSFTVAVNERQRKGEEFVDYANFFDIVLFGNQCGYYAKVLKKGVRVAVAGRLRWASWEKDGEKRSKVSIIANQIDLLAKTAEGEAEEDVPFDTDGGLYAEDVQF